MADNNNTEIQTDNNISKKLAILSIILGVLIISIGYVVYKYFNNTYFNDSKVPTSNVANVEITIPENKPEIKIKSESDSMGIVPVAKLGDSKGIVAGTSVVSTPAKTPTVIKSEVTNDSNGISNAKTSTEIKSWKANDYKNGDIVGNSHTVVYGDTLWEISEGAYGLGQKWPVLATTNNVKYLANGNPLIVEGQILTIPR